MIHLIEMLKKTLLQSTFDYCLISHGCEVAQLIKNIVGNMLEKVACYWKSYTTLKSELLSHN